MQIVPGSGHGWDMFKLKSHNTNKTANIDQNTTNIKDEDEDQVVNEGADLCSKVLLDYENPLHRREFHFKIQVSDKVR